MAVTIGLWISGVIALAIVVVGMRFLIVPYAAAANYGVAVKPDPKWDAFLSSKAVRDIASGLFTALLIVNRSAHLLGLFLLAASIIPFSDAAIVLRHGGSKTAALGIHGTTAVTMVVAGVLLLAG